MENENQTNTLGESVRSLSHDLGATLMLLEGTLSRLRESLEGVSCKPPLRGRIDSQISHADACLRQSKQFAEDLGRVARGGDMEMTPSRVEPTAVIDRVLFEQDELLRKRNIRIEIRRPLPSVWCNESRLKQIVTNIVRNAALHGCDAEHPQITISAIVPKQSDGERLIGFRIHDNGPGIDHGRRDEVFLPGRRLDNSHARGSGMGLAIVKKLAAHYKGRAYVDADCIQGTAFVVVFPEQPVAEGASGRTLNLDGSHAQKAHSHTTEIRRRKRL